MPVSRRKGAPGKADTLYSRLVRSRGYCEARKAHDEGLIGWHPQCSGQLETSHIAPRTYATTRTDLENALCLCSSAHRYWHTWGDSNEELTDAVYGSGHYAYIKQRARDGVAVKVDWDDRVEVLERLANERRLL